MNNFITITTDTTIQKKVCDWYKILHESLSIESANEGLDLYQLNGSILAFRQKSTMKNFVFDKKKKEFIIFTLEINEEVKIDVHESFYKLHEFEGKVKKFTSGGILISSNNKKFVCCGSAWNDLSKLKLTPPIPIHGNKIFNAITRFFNK